MSSFLDFLQTGRLGKIECGMPSARFSESMGGRPEPFGTPPGLFHWASGPVQLTFHRKPAAPDAALMTITLKPRQAQSPVLAALDWRDEVTAPPMDFDAFRAWLDENGLRTVGGNVHGRDRWLVLESGVRVEFDEAGLHTASFTPKRESDSRQITVSLSRSDLELVKREAKAQGSSVSKICAEWIREHAARLQQVESVS